MTKVHPKTIEAYMLLHSGILAIAKAERQGFRVDVDYVKTQRDSITKQIEDLEKDFKNSGFFKKWKASVHGAEINTNSGAQLGKYLYEVRGKKPKKFTPKGNGSTDEDALTQLNIPALNKILKMRKLRKIRDTYFEGFLREQVNGYIHPFFNLHLVRTFRSSSDKPNFQNIPKRDKEVMRLIRDALYPRSGHQLLEIDYSGLEVRIAACYHNDPKMLKYIKDPTTDMHRDMTKEIFMLQKFNSESEEHQYLRAATKNGFVFPQFYGDYYKNNAESLACEWGKLPMTKWKSGMGVEVTEGIYLADHLITSGITTYKKFENHLKDIEADFWDKRFPDYRNWKDNWWSMYKKYGFIDMKTGFRCSGVMSKNDVTNYPVQGAAFHCLLWSFIQLTNALYETGMKTKVIGQIHDSIILDVDPAELEKVLKIARKITTTDLRNHWKWISVPLDVDAEICPVDASWANKEHCKI